jgi:hypothetical protein
MIGEQARELLVQLLEQLGRAFDIREKEGYGACWQSH